MESRYSDNLVLTYFRHLSSYLRDVNTQKPTIGLPVFLKGVYIDHFYCQPMHGFTEWMSKRYPDDWNSRRRKVYRRDNYTCQNCGAKGGSKGDAELHAHHIVPKSDGGSHKKSNLQTLCKECHDAIHQKNKIAPTGSSPSKGGILGKKSNSFLKKAVWLPAWDFSKSSENETSSGESVEVEPVWFQRERARSLGDWYSRSISLVLVYFSICILYYIKVPEAGPFEIVLSPVLLFLAGAILLLIPIIGIPALIGLLLVTAILYFPIWLVMRYIFEQAIDYIHE